MASYTVVAPCVIGDLHYAKVPAHPVEVDDRVAAELLAAGLITPTGDSEPTEQSRTARRRNTED